MKKVLVIAYYFPPMGLSGVQRTLKFVKYLPQFDWQPVVLTTDTDSYYAYDESLLNELNDNHIIYRTNDTKKSKNSRKFPSTFKQRVGRYLSGTFFIPDSKRYWISQAIEKGKEIIEKEKPDIIFSTAPPYSSHVVATKLASNFDIPFVLDYRDMWVGNPFIFMPTIFHKNYHKQLESAALKAAAKTIVISRSAKEHLLAQYKFLNHNDIDIIHHGFDPEDLNIDAKKTDSNKFVITHAGMFQDDRNPEPFFKAFKQFVKKNNYREIELRLIGLMRKNHIKLLQKHSIENHVTLTGNISHSETIQNLFDSDLLWLLQNDTIRTPGKLYEYFGTGKPIIATVPDGEMKELVLSSGVGFSSSPSDPAEILKKLYQIYSLWTKDKLPNKNPKFIESFDRQYLTRKLSYILSYSY